MVVGFTAPAYIFLGSLLFSQYENHTERFMHNNMTIRWIALCYHQWMWIFSNSHNRIRFSETSSFINSIIKSLHLNDVYSVSCHLLLLISTILTRAFVVDAKRISPSAYDPFIVRRNLGGLRLWTQFLMFSRLPWTHRSGKVPWAARDCE